MASISSSTPDSTININDIPADDINSLKLLLSHEQECHQTTVNQLRETLQELRIIQERLYSEEEHRNILEQVSMESSWEWDLINDIFSLSPNWKNILGLDSSELQMNFDEWMSRIHTEDADLLTRTLEMCIKDSTMPLCREYRIQDHKGGYVWVLMNGIALRDSQGNAYRMVTSHLNITEQKKLRKLLKKNASYDYLTGLPNRNLFLDHLTNRLSEMQDKTGIPFAVLLINIDHFKQYNDSLGPLICDRILMEISQRLENICLTADVVGRWGGDEFAFIYNDYDSIPSLELFVKRLLQRIEDPVKINGMEICLRANIGIALSNAEYQKADEMIRDADIAMCNVRKIYPHRYNFFHASMLQETNKAFYIETSLRKALERQEITIAYQPIVNLQTMKIEGFEALMRWPHPKLGFISPGEFIPLAEESDLILSLGNFVLNTACHQAAQWNRESNQPLFISINVSPKQLMDPEFLTILKTTLNESGICPSCVELEITETAVIDDPVRAMDVINKIVKLGISLSIDDFGTGNSSLATLHKYPFKTLKIDRSFILNLENDMKSRELFSHIVNLAKGLHMDIVVEGIETKPCLDIIHLMNCEYGQGYYFSKAVPSAEAQLLLEKQFIQGAAL